MALVFGSSSPRWTIDVCIGPASAATTDGHVLGEVRFGRVPKLCFTARDTSRPENLPYGESSNAVRSRFLVSAIGLLIGPAAAKGVLLFVMCRICQPANAIVC
jgi:hypothetical protein